MKRALALLLVAGTLLAIQRVGPRETAAHSGILLALGFTLVMAMRKPCAW